MRIIIIYFYRRNVGGIMYTIVINYEIVIGHMTYQIDLQI